MPHLAVPFGERHIVDRPNLEQARVCHWFSLRCAAKRAIIALPMRTLDIQYKARRCRHMIERDLFETQKVMWEIFARSQSAERGQCRTSSTLTFLLRFGGCRQDSHAAVWIAVLDEPAHVSRFVPLEAHLVGLAAIVADP